MYVCVCVLNHQLSTRKAPGLHSQLVNITVVSLRQFTQPTFHGQLYKCPGNGISLDDKHNS